MSKTKHTTPLITLTLLFFMWGFLTCMNDILIPYLKAVFDLEYWQAMLVQFAFFGAYFIGSLLYFLYSIKFGDPINKIGYKSGMVIGLGIAAIGCFLFYPAAQFVSYTFFLSALFVLGLGFTLLQISANPYVSILGDEASASSRLNLVQAFNSLGTTIAPVLGGYLIFEFFFDNTSGAAAIKTPYLIFGILFILVALLISKIKLPQFTNNDLVERKAGALQHSNLTYGILAIFVYVGGEVAIGSFLINFIGLEEIIGADEALATKYLAFYWGGAMIGRFSGALSMSAMNPTKKYLTMMLLSALSYVLIFSISGFTFQTTLPYLGLMVLNFIAFILGKSYAGRTLGIFALLCIFLIMGTMFSSGRLAMWLLIGVGLFNSIMWPNIFTLAISGLGKYTSQGSSLLVMAILGGALIPVFQGGIADVFGVQISFIIPLLCYVYILFYGWVGSTKKKF
ncbi:sugar MFS transporter [Aquimarina sp. U1-2]|uniref:sugar MFS transporter n=1 Tax=Aquimarina sp. U1-2 TaxID=2823141 RepID=UPI001AEC8DBF|nr:sugar MFS transporter [Aquimarina sp. U1-2]MBP2830670.1 sugar MFS transporter [Aquimarina sp. U1-2]